LRTTKTRTDEYGERSIKSTFNGLAGENYASDVRSIMSGLWAAMGGTSGLAGSGDLGNGNYAQNM